MHHFNPGTYVRPSTVGEALNLLSEHGSDAMIIAGGTDLLVEKPRGIGCLVDISSLPLDYIEEGETGLRIGALTTLEGIRNHGLLNGPFTVLAEAARNFGHKNVRNLATVGGNLCSSVPSADLAPPFIVLDAEVKISGPDGVRTVAMDEFFVDVRKNVLRDDELLTEIRVLHQPPRTGTAFAKIGRTSVDIALVNAAVRITLRDDGTCSEVRIALGSVAPIPLRVVGTEGLLIGRDIDAALIDEAAEAASKEIRPISDVRSSAGYRREAGRVLVKRCITMALERASQE